MFAKSLLVCGTWIIRRNDVRFVVGIELDNDEIGIVREMVSTAKSKILGGGFTNGTVGELRSGVGEEGIPPIEEHGGIAVRRNWVVASAMTGRDWKSSALDKVKNNGHHMYSLEPPMTLIVTG